MVVFPFVIYAFSFPLLFVCPSFLLAIQYSSESISPTFVRSKGRKECDERCGSYASSGSCRTWWDARDAGYFFPVESRGQHFSRLILRELRYPLSWSESPDVQGLRDKLLPSVAYGYRRRVPKTKRIRTCGYPLPSQYLMFEMATIHQRILAFIDATGKHIVGTLSLWHVVPCSSGYSTVVYFELHLLSPPAKHLRIRFFILFCQSTKLCSVVLPNREWRLRPDSIGRGCMSTLSRTS